MIRLTALAILMLVLAGCATAESPPTATAIPPTNTPLPSTATSIPPTSTPNPDAEKTLMELSEAINDKDIEAALALFAGAANVFGFDDHTYEGKDEIEFWLNQEIPEQEAFYRFTEFIVEGDDVTWTWFVRRNHPFLGAGEFLTRLCVGNATMQDVQISFLTHRDCHDA